MIPEKDCPDCNGKGSVLCSVCEGEGTVEHECNLGHLHVETCGNCDGDGRVRCDTCDSYGKVEDEDYLTDDPGL